ncbi:ATP-binding protein [Mesorhizobium sp. M0571]|uniref:ATP-binding protein n=1 Tax=Mesorhizobium sp. M0571 TaxID=2956960 RepID=UPI00333896BF
MIFANLNPEWQRVETLACLVAETRRDGTPSQGSLDRLRSHQDAVETARKSGVWRNVAAKPLSGMEYDVLACAVAPEIFPRVAWLFQSLSSRAADPYPSMHFLHELLGISTEDTPLLYDALDDRGRLRNERLIRLDGQGPFAVIQPAPGLLRRLMNKPIDLEPPPGATLVRNEAGWDDLILPAAQIDMLREYLSYMICRTTVVEEWGAQPPAGPVALFAGPSGTGKTLTASVIANSLGWPLFRVDLGRLVSKYIGETEKNLNALFDAAHDAPMVLQFDEADSLFSKRGEVREARDRYANLEVSHLLARIEDHNGPCILTTNLRDQLDSAFARRFQVVIDFPRPDLAARARLWRRLLPPRAPMAANIDIEMIAASADLAGGSIRNAALHAAVTAAADRSPITLSHIARAIWRELAKAGRPVGLGELGELAAHIEGERA